MSTASVRQSLRSARWLVQRTEPAAVLTPEKTTKAHAQLRDTVTAFVSAEVLPMSDELERKNWQVARQLIAKCGALGLLGTNISEEYGGADRDQVSALVLSEALAAHESFGATFAAHANLAILPIYWFGTSEQKHQYLPGLISGRTCGAYCLSEPGSGTDALGARTCATRQADGSFVISGEKMWITNGGFADVFIVFAAVDGEQFTAFLVERTWPGVSSGREERKLGLRGASTTAVVLQDVEVPPKAVLGEIGKGHKVAFNVLNFGRFKLGSKCSGSVKNNVREATTCAAAHTRSDWVIASAGAVAQKLGEMTARAYALESMLYRTAGLIDDHTAAVPPDTGGATPMLVALAEFALEASIAKVFGSETADYVIDENVQIHGRHGVTRGGAPARHYCDARANRIVEGTNEINRLLISGLLMKKAMKGEVPLAAMETALDSEEQITIGCSGTVLLSESRVVDIFKMVGLMVASRVAERFGGRFECEQEVMTLVADLLIDTYVSECVILRARDAVERKLSNAPSQVDAARVFLSGAASRIELAARSALAAMFDGDALAAQLLNLHRLSDIVPANTVVMRRRLAAAAVSAGGYVF